MLDFIIKKKSLDIFLIDLYLLSLVLFDLFLDFFFYFFLFFLKLSRLLPKVRKVTTKLQK